jgi:hypothetical protein
MTLDLFIILFQIQKLTASNHPRFKRGSMNAFINKKVSISILNFSDHHLFTSIYYSEVIFRVRSPLVQIHCMVHYKYQIHNLQ